MHLNNVLISTISIIHIMYYVSLLQKEMKLFYVKHPKFYGKALYKVKKCFQTPSKLIKTFNHLMRRGFMYTSVVKSLRMIFFGKNIDFLIGSFLLN